MKQNMRKYQIVWLLICLLFCSSALPAADWTTKYLPGSLERGAQARLDSIYASSTRQVMALNGEWQARRAGEETWHQVRVPGAYDFEGEVEFKRTFRLDSTYATHAFELIAYGIGNRCTLFLNGRFIGSHDQGRMSLTIDLDSGKLNLGAENELTVITDNTLLPRSGLPLQHSPGLGRNYGGIFRDIFLLAKPLVFISKADITEVFSAEFDTCRLAIAATIYLPEDRAHAEEINFFVEVWQRKPSSLLLRSERLPLQVQDGDVQAISTITLPDFTPWTPDQPYLYELRLYLTRDLGVVDEVRLNIGLNQVSVNNGRFSLNGERVKLRGVDWYSVFPETGAVADWEALQQDVRAIKNLGANAVHVVGGAAHPDLLRLCDRIGLLVFTELPLSFVPPQRFADPAFVAQVASYFEATVTRNRLHPSSAAIGVGRDLGLEQRGFPGQLRKLFSKAEIPLFQSFRVLQAEYIPEEIDLVWVDLYHHRQAEREQWFANLNHPVLISSGSRLETPDASPRHVGNSRGSDEQRPLWPQEWQAARLHRAMQQLVATVDPAGMFIHTFADWRGNHPPLGFAASKRPWLNQTGLVSFERERRIAYELVEDVFKQREPLRTSVQAVSAQTPNLYPVVGLGLVLFFLFIFKRSRRFRGNLQRIYKFPHGFYTDLRENRRIPVLHTLAVGCLTCAILGTIFSSLVFDLRNHALFDEILNHLIPTDSLKLKVGYVIWQPALAIAITSMSVLLVGLALSVALRTASFIIGVRLPSIQFVTLVFWASANFIFLLPIIPIYHRIIAQTNLVTPAVLVVLLFGLWFFGRLIRAVKVTFLLSAPQMLVLVIVMGLVIGGGLGWYLDRELALFDYIPLYWEAVRT